MLLLLHAVLLALASARLTTLITTDTILNPLREKIWNKYPPELQKANIGYLITCPHCTSVWASLVLVICYTIGVTHTAALFVSSVLALSLVSGHLASFSDRYR